MDASDYSSFEVHATRTTNGTETLSIPLDVAYTVNGERTTRTVSVEYTPDAAVGGQPRQSGSSSLVPIAVTGVAILVVGGVIVRRFL